MFDFEKYTAEIFNRISLMFGIEDEDNAHIYSKRFKKIYYWFGETGIPAFLNFVSIIMLFWIFFRVYSRSGFEKTVIILLILNIVAVRGLKKK